MPIREEIGKCTCENPDTNTFTSAEAGLADGHLLQYVTELVWCVSCKQPLSITAWVTYQVIAASSGLLNTSIYHLR